MKRRKLGFWRPMVIASTIIVATTLVYWWSLKLHPPVPPTAGVFGDSFGALNTLFSGLAFAGVIVTLMLQQQELRLQRKELRESRKAQQGSREALTRQALLLAYTGYLQSSADLGGGIQARAAVAEVHDDLVRLIGELTGSEDKSHRMRLEASVLAQAIQRERQRVQLSIAEIAGSFRGRSLRSFFGDLKNRGIVAHIAFTPGPRDVRGRSEQVLAEPRYEVVSGGDETILGYTFPASAVDGSLDDLIGRHGLLPYDSKQSREISEWQTEIGDRKRADPTAGQP